MGNDPLDDDAATAEERTANGEHLEPVAPPEPPMGGDAQLSLDVGKIVPAKSRKVQEATISLSAAEVPVDGLFRPEERYPFLVMGVPGNVTTHYLRDSRSTATPKAVTGVKLRQSISVDTVGRADDASAIRELFGSLLSANAEAAGELLDALREDMAGSLATAA